jgi:AcrR family transcriptional regulator
MSTGASQGEARRPTKPKRPGRPRDPAVRRAILAAAEALIREKGYAAFSIEAAAALAGVAKQSIYRRWPSRADLLLDLYLGEEAEAGAGSGAAGGDFRARIRDYVMFSLDRLFDPSRAALLRGLAIEAQSDPEVRAVILARITAPRLESGRRLLAEGIAQGQVRPDLDSDVALRFLFGAIWFDLLFAGPAIQRGLEQRILAQFIALIRYPSAEADG